MIWVGKVLKALQFAAPAMGRKYGSIPLSRPGCTGSHPACQESDRIIVSITAFPDKESLLSIPETSVPKVPEGC